jgi:hypothetical protein
MGFRKVVEGLPGVGRVVATQPREPVLLWVDCRPANRDRIERIMAQFGVTRFRDDEYQDDYMRLGVTVPARAVDKFTETIGRMPNFGALWGPLDEPAGDPG